MNEVFTAHLKCCKCGGECQGHTPPVSPLSLKFGTSHATYRRTACSAAARNPGEITISLPFVCREPSCIQKHNSPLRFVFRLHCTSICIQRGPLGVSASAVPSANEVFITQDFAFWYVTPIPFPISLPPGPPAAGGVFFTRERHGRPDRQHDINRREWPMGSASGCESVFEARGHSPTHNGGSQICRFYLHFRASNNHLA